MRALEQWKDLPKYAFCLLISLGSPMLNHICIFTYIDIWYIHCCIFRFNFLKIHKHIFHADGIGEVTGKNRRNRSTNFQCWTCLDKPSILGHSVLHLSSHQLYHLYIYIEKMKKKEDRNYKKSAELRLRSRENLISISVIARVRINLRNIYKCLEIAFLRSFQVSCSL